MKKILLFFVLIFGLASTTFAQNETADEAAEKDGPVMTFETTTVSYGEIEKGSEPLRKVKFTNTGNQPLVINNARGSCGCTVPQWPKEPIMPGESNFIEVRYDTKRVGPINKTVKIKTNEGPDVQHILYVKGKVNNVKKEESVPSSDPNLLAPQK
ncbi:MAG: DUF1573 domain-containing protein [Saprospiraceae bacterium]|nr:DUF1573 domain-containing protein [Saprospiraceae bacterium]